MLTPSAHDIVRIWELGQDKPGWYQALLVPAAAFPECAHGELADLALGMRNHYPTFIDIPELSAFRKKKAASKSSSSELLGGVNPKSRNELSLRRCTVKNQPNRFNGLSTSPC